MGSKASLIVRDCLEIKNVRIIMFFNRRLMTIVRRNAYKQFLADFEHLRVIFFQVKLNDEEFSSHRQVSENRKCE